MPSLGAPCWSVPRRPPLGSGRRRGRPPRPLSTSMTRAGSTASRFARHWQPTQVTGDAWLDALRAELKAAAAEGRPVSVGAARHSMGGQALPPAT